MPASPYRDLYNVPAGIYLASHSVGAQTKRGLARQQSSFVNPWNDKGGEAWNDWLSLIDDFCAALASLLGGGPEDYCPQTNLSSGLTKYLMALPPSEKPRKVLMHASAFPSMGFAVQALLPSGFELSLIPSQLPAADPQVWDDAMDDSTAFALITHVHSNTGVRSPVEDITAVCRNKGVRSVVDIAQSAGIVPIDLKTWQADMVIGSCVKWLCGGPGAGFMWVNPETPGTLSPQDAGWFSHENPFEFDIRDFRYAQGAKRFWGGTPSVAPYAFALGGIETALGIGIDRIRRHNTALMQTVHPNVDPAKVGGTLCLPINDAQDTALKHAGCQFDRRGEIARLSFHIYNTQNEADRVRDILESNRA